MIFEFADTVREIDFTQVTSSADIAAFISTGEFEKFYLSFGLDEKAFEKFSRDDRFFRSKTEKSRQFLLCRLGKIFFAIFCSPSDRRC